jgi:Ca-activated chloride channel homolog
MTLSDFHFLRPLWLLALIPLAVLVTLLHQHRLSRGNWTAACDRHLLPYLLLDKPVSRQRWSLALLAIGGLLAIAALAGPTWEHLPVPVFRNSSALVIVLDLSRSMDASDIKPSRWQRARFKIVDILKRRKDGQSALVVYARDAFTVTPLTDDNDTISSQLAALSPSIMPSHGSIAEAAPALERAADLMKRAGLRSGDLLLITDGVTEQAIEAAKLVRSQGYTVSVLGVGTRQGAPIPLPGGFLKDDSGAIVIPRLHTAPLKELAAAGSGLFHTLTTDNSDLSALHAVIDSHTQRSDGKNTRQRIEQWYEIGPWLLLALLPIAALGFRRGTLGALLLCLLPIGEDANALEWKDLWATPDQQAHIAFQQRRMKQAAKIFEEPAWKAAAAYRAGRYEQAIQTLDGLDAADSYYNKGNALARLGRYEEAMAAYDKALESKPGLEDARYNRELLEQLLKQQQQKNQQQQSSEGDRPDKEQAGQNADNSKQTQGQGGNRAGQTQSGPPQQSNSNTTPRRQDAQNDTGTPPPGEPNTRMSKRREEARGEGGEPTEATEAETRPMPDPAPENKGEDEKLQPRADVNQSEDEQQQANEQWLRRIPDDPAGLLRRKFEYQYQLRRQKTENSDR